MQPLAVGAQTQALLADPEPRAAAAGWARAFCPSGGVLSASAPGLTVLSSFPVKADRAESPCVDAALDTLGTAGRVARTDHCCTAPHLPSRAKHSAY